MLLEKSSAKLKIFVTQLQSIFVKCMTHPEKNVREAGQRNVIELLKLKPRVDLLINDLCGLEGPEEVVVQSLRTLQEVVKQVQNIPAPAKTSAINRILGELKDSTPLSVAHEAGRLLALIEPNSSSILQSLPENTPGKHIAEILMENA